MFGNDLSEDTIEILNDILPLSQEQIETANAKQLRIELEALYDMGKANVFGGALNLSVLDEEVDLFSKVSDGYSKFMQEYEEYLDNN